MHQEDFLRLVRAKIAIDNVPKKFLARKCKVNRPTFSYFIHGDKPMTDFVKDVLIRELELEEYLDEYRSGQTDILRLVIR